VRGSLVKILFFIFILVAFITFLPVQNIIADETRDSNKIDEPNLWFRVKEVADHVWCIKDYRGDNMYLVVGDDSALLIDTGIGAGDLKSCVRSITNLPLLVVNTHGHHDHVGGNFQFSIARANPEDFELINKSCSKENHDNFIKKALLDNPSLKLPVNEESKNFKPAGLMMIKSGFVFNLGKRKLEVIETPGHTRGSICLIDAGNKLLFAGDDNNPIINWLFLETCLPLEIYLKSLERLKLRANEFNTILPGHGEPVDKGLLDEQIICAKNILSGNCKGESYKEFSETALKCSYKRATIAYDPNNLFEKKKL
jgi:hydroxyacylglutathione hydrolase